MHCLKPVPGYAMLTGEFIFTSELLRSPVPSIDLPAAQVSVLFFFFSGDRNWKLPTLTLFSAICPCASRTSQNPSGPQGPDYHMGNQNGPEQSDYTKVKEWADCTMIGPNGNICTIPNPFFPAQTRSCPLSLPILVIPCEREPFAGGTLHVPRMFPQGSTLDTAMRAT
jgi:hypothetical protein